MSGRRGSGEAGMTGMLDAVEEAYGTGVAAYDRLAELRDERTRAVLEPLGRPVPPAVRDR